MTNTYNPLMVEEAVSNELERRAFAGGSWLINALDHEGSGYHWIQNQFKSSAIGEYPALQEGELLSSIGVVQADYKTFEIGSLASLSQQGFEEAMDLESLPPSQGGRPLITQAFGDYELHAAMLDA